MKLTVSNFQIHQKPKTVDIPEGETTYLEGDSDIGKSALMRAMRWVGENKPDGGSFVTFKQPRGTTSVVTFEAEGRTVTRERGKSKNLYKLDEETFEAFGRSVPEPIAKFLSLSPYAFQCQGEVPFLIGASPTEAAKILSDACGLGVIDTAVQFVRQKKTVVEAEIRKSEILLESAQQRLSQATSQLPLADALEAAARVGEEFAALKSTVGAVEDALADEPEGEPLDLTGAAHSASLARSAGELVQLLTGQALALRRALRDEPAGELLDVSDAVVAGSKAHELLPALSSTGERVARMRSVLFHEPTDTLRDVSLAKDAFARCQALDAERRVIGELANSRMLPALCSEPYGELRGTAPVRAAFDRALASFEERAMLEKMLVTIRVAIQNEPQGVLEDVTKLKQQRAQIKVCPTCNREL